MGQGVFLFQQSSHYPMHKTVELHFAVSTSRFNITLIPQLRRMSFDTNKSWVENVILSDDGNRRIVKCLNIRESTLTNKAKNATCEITRIAVQVELGSGAVLELTFIAKKMPQSEGMRTFLMEFGLYDREIRAYGKLEKMEKLMADRGDFRETLWCQLKGYNRRVILLEDLTAKGYGPLNNFKIVDEERTLYVLRELARFHAMGRVLIEQNAVDFTEITPLKEMSNKSLEMFHHAALKALSVAVQNNWGPEWSAIVHPLKQIIENVEKIVGKMWEMSDNTMNVICHGDCWKGNIMLKTDAFGNNLALKFVDFQVSTYASYIFDLSLFLVTSVDHELRLTKTEQLLRAYRDSLTTNMEFYKLDPSKAPTLDGMKNHLESLRAFNVVMMAIYWPTISNETEERVVLDGFNAVTGGEEHCAIFRPEMYSSAKSKKILGQELKGLIGWKLI